jgi:hypothetical protein
MKTAMQQHLEWLKARMVVTEQMEQELLDQEMSQLLDAWEDGHDSFSSRNGKLYYNETFKTN